MGMIAPNPPRMRSFPPMRPDTKYMQSHEALRARREYEEALERWHKACEEEQDDFEALGEMSWGWALLFSCMIIFFAAAALFAVGVFYWLAGATGFIVLAVAGALVFELANFLRKKL